MLFVPSSELALRALKLVVRGHVPGVPSSHLTEALAVAAGARTHASLLAGLDAGRTALTFDDDLFTSKLEALGYRLDAWPGFASLGSASWAQSPHKSARAQAWRNMLAAAVNSGIAQGHFTLKPDGNHWPDYDPDPRAYNSHLYPVAMPDGIPALARVHDIGHGELSLHVALWPKNPDWLGAPGSGFSAGDAVAAGWLERKSGAWLMFDRRRGGMLEVAVRRHRQQQVLGMMTIPLGYADHGKFYI